MLIGDKYSTVPSSIPSTEVESLVSHISGILPLHHSERKNFPSVSLFNRPKANVMFLLEGLGTDYLNGKHLRHPLQILKTDNSKLIPIEHDDEVSSISLLTTLMTGSPVEKHGILSKFWQNGDGQVEHAFSGTESEPFEATMADVLLQTAEGNSLLLSSCAEKAISSALSPRRSLIDANSGRNVVSMWWDGETFSGSDSPISSHFSLNRAKLYELFETKTSSLFPSSPSNIEVTYKKDEKIFSVTVPTHGQEVFDMERREDFLLFAELFSHYHALSSLSSPSLNHLVTDDHPDLLSFGFSALQELTRSGVYSSKTRAAVYLVDAAIQKLSDMANGLYSKRTSMELISLGSSLSGLDLPYSGKYVLSSGEDESPGNETEGGDVTEEDIAIYHTCLWTGIALFLAILAAIYSLVYMEVHQDPLIFRPTFK